MIIYKLGAFVASVYIYKYTNIFFCIAFLELIGKKPTMLTQLNKNSQQLIQ